MSVSNFVNKKCKAIVIFIFSMISLGIFIVSALFATLVCQKGYGLVVGILLMVLAIPFHILGKKTPFGYLISFAINSVANGFSVSAYYLVKDVAIDFGSMIIAAVLAVAVLLLVYLMMQVWSKTKRVTVSLAVIVNVLLMVAEVALWITRGTNLYSFGFFCLLIALFYLCVFGITINHEERPVLRDLSFGSFGSFIILTVVVIFILSEGDILEGLDFDWGRDGKKKNKTKISG